ncbi:MAG: helix-turn-helix domain-containing protein [Oscillospiraceae bacterium]|nr:helix-turn-helix domain-containing protein [Oscillospiraceae bacterium]
MEDLRVFGNMLEKLRNENDITNDALCEKLDCTKEVLINLLKGCVVPTTDQLVVLADVFNVTPEELFLGDRDHYEASVVHYMYDFKSPEAREKILDIIESYSKLVSGVK